MCIRSGIIKLMAFFWSSLLWVVMHWSVSIVCKVEHVDANKAGV